MTTTYTLIETNTTALDFSDKESLLAYLTPSVAPNQQWPFKQPTPAVPQVEAPEEPTRDYYAEIMHMLDDPRFTLRTLLSVCARTGLSADLVFGLLNDEGVEYITRTKRGTRELLIGLASRN